MYTAHIRKTDGAEQSILSHSKETAEMCRAFGVQPWKDLLYTMGMLHDIGKYQPDFQKRIHGASIKIPHALCGAKAAKERFGSKGTAMILQYAIAGHHVGLPDGGTKADTPDRPTLYGTLYRDTQDYSAFDAELSIPKPDFDALNAYLTAGCGSNQELAERLAFITRYAFSCLTDADWLGTEKFCTGNMRQTLPADFAGCLEKVNAKMESFQNETLLQKTRARLQQQAFQKTDNPSEVYLMNMPTGSGKTLCSIKFALERAIASGKKRIIYIIPYNSIIDQTAKEFETIFGDQAAILRHQSTFAFENLPEDSEQDPLWLKQAAENWDAEIILTTAVQFFESVYSNKRTKLRKFHHMAESILIFDEAHLMPQDYLQPCLQAIGYLCRYLNSEAVFLTATMPDFEHLLREYALPDLKILDLVSDRSAFSAFHKCSFEQLGIISDEALILRAQKAPSVLIVVNSRAAANQLYRMCTQGKRYHLSTYMTANHRIAVIDQIKLELAQLEKDFPGLISVPPERRITVISTSLIEAGVDLDFFTVYRQLWGLDSILQAGGRCNREGKRQNAKVFIFEREDDLEKPQALFQSFTKGILSEFADISCPESIDAYYQRLFFVKHEDIVKNSIGPQCPLSTLIPFRTYADHFELIEKDKTVSIAVAQDEKSKDLQKTLQNTGHVNARAVQPYTLTVRVWQFKQLLEQGVLNDYGSGIYWLTNLDYYNQDTGIVFEGKDIYCGE